MTDINSDVMCLECGWAGDSSELASKTNKHDDKKFTNCPDCDSDDIEDIEEEEIQ